MPPPGTRSPALCLWGPTTEIYGGCGCIASLVEAISETTAGREAQGRFLFTAPVELLEQLGFELLEQLGFELLEQLGFARGRQVGKHAWIVSRTVEPGSIPPTDG
jgi:predicted RNA binding protein YcfA (HicA-like mRNA interferase family)